MSAWQRVPNPPSDGCRGWPETGGCLSLSLRAETGSYYSVTTGSDTTLEGMGAPGSNQILEDPYCASPSPSCWLNPKAFSNISGLMLGTLGNVGSGSISGPTYLTVNMAVNMAVTWLYRDFSTFARSSRSSCSGSIQTVEQFLPRCSGPRSFHHHHRHRAETPPTLGKFRSRPIRGLCSFALKYVF